LRLRRVRAATTQSHWCRTSALRILLGIDVDRNHPRGAGNACAPGWHDADASDTEDRNDISAPYLTEMRRSAVARRHRTAN